MPARAVVTRAPFAPPNPPRRALAGVPSAIAVWKSGAGVRLPGPNGVPSAIAVCTAAGGVPLRKRPGVRPASAAEALVPPGVAVELVLAPAPPQAAATTAATAIVATAAPRRRRDRVRVCFTAIRSFVLISVSLFR